MELNSRDQRAELFGWVDSLGADHDGVEQELNECSLSLYESMCLTMTKPKVSLEDRLIDDYVSGNLKGRFQKVRLIMVLVGQRIFDCLDEGEIFKLMEVDDFIGGKAMSYKLFDVSSSQTKPDSTNKTIMPKTEQAMLRIRKTNLILNRPESRKASIVSIKDAPALSVGFSASSVSQLTRPDTAESLTSSRPRLAPIATTRAVNPKPHTQAIPATPQNTSLPNPAPKPQTPTTARPASTRTAATTSSKLFTLPLGAAHQLQKHPEQEDAHLLRFAEAAQRRLLRGWSLCMVGQSTVAAAVCEFVAAVAEVLGEVEGVRVWARHHSQKRGEGGGNRVPAVGTNRFWEVVGQAAELGRKFEGVLVGKELEALEAQAVRGSGVKDVVQWCQKVLELSGDQFSGESLPEKLILGMYSVKIYSELRAECDKNNHLTIANLASNSNSRWLSRKLPILLSQAGKNLVRFQSAVESSNLLIPVSQQLGKFLTALRQLFDVSKTLGRLLGAGDEGLRSLIQAVGTTENAGKYWTEEGSKSWPSIKECVDKETEKLRQAGKLLKEG